MSEMFEGAIVLNEYRIMNRLGEGGQAEVYLGQSLVTSENHALKIFHSSPGGEETFLGEGRLSMGLPSHDNLLRTFGYGVKDIRTTNRSTHRRVVMAMEYAEGGSLKDLIPNPSSITRHVGYIGQAACGLQQAHNVKVIHRDVKPANLLLSARDRVKVADFGIARPSPRDTFNPTTQVVAATFPFAALEQLEGKATRFSDIHSLGVTAFKLLTGEYPFMPEDPGNMVQWAKLHTPGRYTMTFRRILGEDMNNIYQELEPEIAKAMALKQEHRHKSMEEFRFMLLDALRRGQAIEDLNRATFTATQPTMPPTKVERPRPEPKLKPEPKTKATPPVEPEPAAAPPVDMTYLKGRRAPAAPKPSLPKEQPLKPTKLVRPTRETTEQERDAAQRALVREKMLQEEWKDKYGAARTRRRILRASAIIAPIIAIEGLLNLEESSSLSSAQEYYQKVSPNVLAFIDSVVQSSGNQTETLGYIADIGRAMVDFSPERAKQYAEALFVKDHYQELTQIGIALARTHTKEALGLFFELQAACEMVSESSTSGRELRSSLSTIAMALGDKLPESVVKSRGRINDAGRMLHFNGFDTLTQELVNHLKYKPYRGTWGLLASKLISAGRYADIEAISPVIADEDGAEIPSILSQFDITKASESSIGSMARTSIALAKSSPKEVRKFIERLTQSGHVEQAKMLHHITANQMPKYTYPLLKESHRDLGPFTAAERYEIAMSIANTHYKQADKSFTRALSAADKAWINFAINPATAAKPTVSALDSKTRLQCVALLYGQLPQPHKYKLRFILPT